MAKRFTDSEKWKDEWFSELEPSFKFLWLYILDNCDHCGIWKPNKKLAEFQIGIDINWESMHQTFHDRIIVLENGKWFIPKFLKFQYPSGLSGRVSTTKGVIQKLLEAGLLERVVQVFGESYVRLNEGLGKSSLGLKDKDKDKDIDKDKDKDTSLKKEDTKEKEKFDFEYIWKQYPNKDSHKASKKHFHASVKTDQDYQDIQTALKKYVNSRRVQEGYIKSGSTWFNNWRDWVNYEDPIIDQKAKVNDDFSKELERRKKLDELSDSLIARGTAGLRK